MNIEKYVDIVSIYRFFNDLDIAYGVRGVVAINFVSLLEKVCPAEFFLES